MIQDTSPEQRRHYEELLRRMTPAQRARTTTALSNGVRTMALAGLRLRNPGADEQELRVRLAHLLYGPSVALRLFGTLPEDAH
jgi:hypothetical protein